ncbi:MAG: DegV family protein, partial [Ardenticatenaceae bacterium]
MIRIVADSGANFPAALAEKYDVAIVPLVVQFGEASYREGLDMTTSEFFGRLATANPLPTTSTPAPADFEEVYREIVAAGDEIISIHLSSKLSGTLN